MSIRNSSHFLKSEKIAIIGASRGLGRELVKELCRHHQELALFLVSRKKELMQKLADEVQSSSTHVEILPRDLSCPEQQNQVMDALDEFAPDRIFYVAGGGPHGAFVDKQWKDHQWALEVSFLAPMRILHRFSHIKQLLFVGSDIAENNSGKNELSYSLSKKGLYSAIEGFLEERPSVDIRLLSPGYMDTSLLPRGTLPRTTHHVLSPETVAAKAIEWISGPKSAESMGWHLVLSTPLKNS